MVGYMYCTISMTIYIYICTDKTTFLIHKIQWTTITNIYRSFKIAIKINNSHELRIRTSAYIGSLQMGFPYINKLDTSFKVHTYTNI